MLNVNVNRKIALSVLMMMALICGLYGTSHAAIKSIEPGNNDTSLIVKFSWSYWKGPSGYASQTFTFKWREKELQGTWSSDKRIYLARWSSYFTPIRSVWETETTTITGLKPGTTYEVMVDSSEGEGTTRYTGLTVSAASRLLESKLDKSVLTLRLNYHAYEKNITKIRGAVSASGIPSLTFQPSNIQRISNTEVNVELDYDGENFDVDTTLIFAVDADAIVGYTGDAFTAGILVTHVKESVELRPSIYWIDDSRDPIRRANLNGTNVEPLLPEARARQPADIALDVVGGKMYWADSTYRGGILRANLDGTNVEHLVESLYVPEGIALDIVGGKIYWADSYSDKAKILRANLDGTNVENLVQYSRLNLTYGIALDIVGGKIYWTEYSKILRANLNGTNIEDFVTGLEGTKGIALDVVGGKIYWTEDDKILRANLNGTNVEDLVSLSSRRQSRGIALDVVGGKMYWTEGGKIRRANLNGTNVKDLITGLKGPRGIALALPSTPSIDLVSSVDLVVEAAQAEPATVAPGETFRLYATLKNQGTEESTATVLRYYRSTDAVISTADTQLSSANREPLAADATLRRYLTVTAPTTPGTYYYGVCVDSVTDESDTANNCSVAVSVTVTAPPEVSADVNEDGTVDVQDLMSIVQQYGQTGTTTADVNDDGVVNIDDLILVAAVLDADAAAAPSLHSQSLEMFTAAEIKEWLSQARQRDFTDPKVRKGILFLEQLLASLIPKETALLANYPNPFNPETWIPYQLSKPADVTLTIYTMNGQVVRRLALGHQPAGIYQNRSRAAYWDGRNAFGEPVASGVYFYTLTAGNFTATRKMLIRK